MHAHTHVCMHTYVHTFLYVQTCIHNTNIHKQMPILHGLEQIVVDSYGGRTGKILNRLVTFSFQIVNLAVS